MLFVQTRLLVTPELLKEIEGNYGYDTGLEIGDAMEVVGVYSPGYVNPLRPIQIIRKFDACSYFVSVFACECAAEIYRIVQKAWGNGWSIAVPICFWNIIRNMPQRDIRLLDFGWAYRRVPFGYQMVGSDDCPE